MPLLIFIATVLGSSLLTYFSLYFLFRNDANKGTFVYLLKIGLLGILLFVIYAVVLGIAFIFIGLSIYCRPGVDCA